MPATPSIPRLSLHTSQLSINRQIRRWQRRPAGQGGDGSAGVARVSEHMMHAVAGANVVLYGQFHCRFNLAGLIITIEHKNGDEVLDSFCFTLGPANTLQKKVIELRPALPPLLDWSGTIECQRPLLDKFKIMVSLQSPFVVTVQTLMRCQLLSACKDLHPISAEQHLHSEPSITAWYGISVLIHDDRGILVGPAH